MHGQDADLSRALAVLRHLGAAELLWQYFDQYSATYRQEHVLAKYYPRTQNSQPAPEQLAQIDMPLLTAVLAALDRNLVTRSVDRVLRKGRSEMQMLCSLSSAEELLSDEK